MSSRSDDGLVHLRTSATCVICSQFYNKPKKLPKCPHVFCLRCLEQLHVKCHTNFPPCPMCRTPIIIRRSDITSLDPAIAEQAIVDFVKQYETCGLCGFKSNPNLECEPCGAFVCDGCEPCHGKLKSSHTVRSIVPSGTTRKTSPKNT